MTGKKPNKLNIETWNGYTMYDGRSYVVTLEIDVVTLIHDLGKRAARNTSGRAKFRSGTIKVKATVQS